MRTPDWTMHVSTLIRGGAAVAALAFLAPRAAAATYDADGVKMMYPAKAGGTTYRLGTGNPTADPEHLKLWADTLTPMTENGVSFWRSTGHPVSYASGEPDGTSHRLMIFASGGTQTYNWQTGAITQGYCGNPNDLNAFEATVYCRLWTLTGTHESVSWSIRGGTHDGPNASSIGITLKNPPGSASSVYKELTWPNYGYTSVTPYFTYTKTSGAWVGIKIVSYIYSGTQVRNLMYLDTTPYNGTGGKNNNWQLYLEWFDTQGVNMPPANYTQAALWAGWMNMFRVDGWTLMDFSILSAREIDPVGPFPPSGLTAATIGYNQINLSWTDQSANETGFKIERQNPNAYGSYVQIGTVGANVTTFNDTAAGAGTTYNYRVRAYNAANSDYSNVVSAATTEITSGRRGHWKFFEGSGLTASDSSGNGNNGTLTGGPVWSTSGKIGFALVFDGIDDAVNAGSGTTLDDLPAMTVSAWIKPNSLGEGSLGRIAQKGTGVGPGWRFLIKATNAVSLAVDYATTDVARESANNVLTLGTWQHVLATWTGAATAANIKLYVNGVETAYALTQDAVGARTSDAALNFYVGNESGLTRTFDGALDDVRVYNRVLSASEIAAVYRAGMP